MAPRVIKLREQEKLIKRTKRQWLPPNKGCRLPDSCFKSIGKRSGRYDTAEAALAAGIGIKKGHPVVQVAIYDRNESKHMLVDLPPA